jgi:hypothetical protein
MDAFSPTEPPSIQKWQSVAEIQLEQEKNPGKIKKVFEALEAASRNAKS